MFPCPRCQHELPANARFCNYCGFNQTNARLESMRAAQQVLNTPQVTPSVPSTPPVPGDNKAAGSMRSIKVEPKQNPLMASGREQIQMTSTPPPRQPIQPIKPTSTPFIPETPQPSNGNALIGHYASEQVARHRSVQLGTGVPQTPRVPGMPVQGPPASMIPGTPHTSQPSGASAMRQIPQAQAVASPYRSYELPLGLPDTVSLSDDSPYASYAPYSDMDNKSLSSTNKAAEQWHKSWRDRQHDEAGPAVNVSRGQASVAEPLLAMQHSILRMRAIVLPKNRENKFGFWMIVVMMVCLFVGLISYIASTYLPGTRLASQAVATSISHADPTLAFQQQNSAQTGFTAGQTIHVQGASFGAHDQIIFLLDSTTLNGTTTTDSYGSFSTTLTIPATQLAGAYALQAQDNHTGQHAFLDLTVIASASNTTSLSLTAQGSAIPSLSFVSTVGQNDPPQKNVVLTNNGSTTLQWSVAAITDDNTGWLVIGDKRAGGQLDPQQSDSLNIGVLTQGLSVSRKAHPYKGEIVFTVANQGQAILPVELQVEESGVEVIISPNPILAAPATDGSGTCQATGLTLVNLNETVINWTVKPSDDFNAQHIHVDGQTTESGTLASSGSDGDTKVIQLTCIGVQLGKSYTLTVYYNGQTETIPVNISNQ